MTQRRAAFLDRDNTLIFDPGYLSDPALVRLLPHVAEGLRQLHDAGLLLVLFSNQSGVGRGYFTEHDLALVHGRLVELLAAEHVTLDATYYCLHTPADNCACRKPAPGQLFTAAAEHNIDLARSFVVGDKPTDVEAGQRAGCRTVLVSESQIDVMNSNPNAHVTDFGAAARWILAQPDLA